MVLRRAVQFWKNWDIQVISASCGADALKLVKEHEFDLVVTDYKMSPMDGLELIKTSAR